MLLLLIMLVVGIPLAIVAWNRGWKWRAMLPLSLGLSLELILGFLLGFILASMDVSMRTINSVLGVCSFVEIGLDVAILGILVWMAIKGHKEKESILFSPASDAPSTPSYNPPPAVASNPVHNTPIITPVAPVYNAPAAAPAAPVYSTPAAKPQPVAVMDPPTVLAPMAKLILPDNSEISIGRADKIIGRHDLEKVVSPDDLKYISRQHVIIRVNCSQYYVEDRNSSNSTKVNGVNITGKGKQELKNGDNIQLADVVTLQFKAGNTF